jgi:hypothetical protein
MEPRVVSINIYKAVRIIRRDAVTLTADEESVRAAIFADLSNRDLLLLTKGDVDVTTRPGAHAPRPTSSAR